MTSPAVLVAGAGPVGLTMAAELLRHGLSVRLVERSPERDPWSSALIVWQRTLELLEPLGAADSIMTHGTPIRRVRLFSDARELVTLRLAMNDCRFREPVLIPQDEVEVALEAALGRQGGRIERGCELIDFMDRGDKIEAMIQRADGSAEHVAADWLVGCDGVHSLVRQRLGLEFTSRPITTRWVTGDVLIDGADNDDEAQFHWHPLGLLTLIPIRQGRWRVLFDGGSVNAGDRPRDPTLDDLQVAVALRGLKLQLSDPTRLTAFVARDAKVDRYGAGRIFIAGGAAHTHGPAGGQGVNTGLQDALNLAWKLAAAHRGGDAELLLGSYTYERAAVAAQVLAQTGRIMRVSALRSQMLRMIRNTAARLVGSRGSVRRQIARRFSELSIAYAGSPLNLDGRDIPRDALRPGDRVPESILRRADGAALPLAELFRDGKPWLFALTGDGPPLVPPPVLFGIDLRIAWVGARQPAERPDGIGLSDPEGFLHRAVCADDGGTRFLLVRPDRHVMANVAASRFDELAALARRVFATVGDAARR